MMKLTSTIAAALLASIAHAGDRLSSDELKSFFTDKTISGKHFKLGNVRTYYGPDGKVHSKAADGSERVGKWWVDENAGKRCIRWNHMSKDLCHYVERNNDDTHTLVHGKNGKTLVEIQSAEDGNQL